MPPSSDHHSISFRILGFLAKLSCRFSSSLLLLLEFTSCCCEWDTAGSSWHGRDVRGGGRGGWGGGGGGGGVVCGNSFGQPRQKNPWSLMAEDQFLLMTEF